MNFLQAFVTQQAMSILVCDRWADRFLLFHWTNAQPQAVASIDHNAVQPQDMTLTFSGISHCLYVNAVFYTDMQKPS